MPRPLMSCPLRAAVLSAALGVNVTSAGKPLVIVYTASTRGAATAAVASVASLIADSVASFAPLSAD